LAWSRRERLPWPTLPPVGPTRKLTLSRELSLTSRNFVVSRKNHVQESSLLLPAAAFSKTGTQRQYWALLKDSEDSCGAVFRRLVKLVLPEDAQCYAWL